MHHTERTFSKQCIPHAALQNKCHIPGSQVGMLPSTAPDIPEDYKWTDNTCCQQHTLLRLELLMKELLSMCALMNENILKTIFSFILLTLQ